MCGKGVGWESPLVTLSITTTILQNKEAILVTRMAGSVLKKLVFQLFIFRKLQDTYIEERLRDNVFLFRDPNANKSWYSQLG